MTGIVFVFIVIVVVLCLSLTSKGGSRQGKIDLMNSILSRMLIRGEGSNAEYYIVNIPIRVHSLFHRNNNSSNELRVKFDSIYFEISKGIFNVGDSNIAYSFQELYSIFQQALKFGKSKITINWRARDLFVYVENHPRLLEAKYLKLLYEEFQDISSIIKDLEKEIAQVEAIIQTVKGSEIYDYQINRYKQGMKILRDSKLRAMEVKEEYFKFLRERTLSFYLEDVEPAVFKLKNQPLNWEAKYQHFHEDFDDLKNMVKEYNALKSQI